MKYKIAFFMAWGNFLALPCPNKKWDDNQRQLMLAFFPIIGFIIGILWVLLWWVLDMLPVAPPLMAALLTVYPFVMSGFIHLDGFMDCNDAILSRRSLEERQRILKDPHVGSFAVITAIILFMLMFASFDSELQGFVGITGIGKYDMLCLVSVPVISRGLSARAVLAKKPLEHSQYRAFDADANKKYSGAVITIVGLAVIVPLALNTFGPADIFGGVEVLRLMQGFFTVCCITTLVHFMAIDFGIEQLGGMCGDISGYALTASEAAAVITLAIV